MAEPIFIPKPGQTDYTNIRYAPVLDVVVRRSGKVLLAKRSANRRIYPNYWATIAGFLDDDQDIETKAYEELLEELGITKNNVASLQRGKIFLREDPDINKTWLIVTVCAEVKNERFTLDWEASEARWFDPKDIAILKLLPGTLDIVNQFFD